MGTSEVTGEKYITIKLSHYINLMNESERLSMLRGGGVDNWEGIDECGWEHMEVLTEQDFEDDSRVSNIDASKYLTMIK